MFGRKRRDTKMIGRMGAEIIRLQQELDAERAITASLRTALVTAVDPAKWQVPFNLDEYHDQTAPDHRLGNDHPVRITGDYDVEQQMRREALAAGLIQLPDGEWVAPHAVDWDRAAQAWIDDTQGGASGQW